MFSLLNDDNSSVIKKKQLPPLKSTVETYRKSRNLNQPNYELAQNSDHDNLQENFVSLNPLPGNNADAEKSSIIKSFYKDLIVVDVKKENQNVNLLHNPKELLNVGVANIQYDGSDSDCSLSNYKAPFKESQSPFSNQETPVSNKKFQSSYLNPNKNNKNQNNFEEHLQSQPEHQGFKKMKNKSSDYHEKRKRSRRSCDFILVHEFLNKDIENNSQRKSFVNQMKKDGLELTETIIGELVFTEIYAPFGRLCKEAEHVSLHMPLEGVKMDQNLHSGFFERCLTSFKTEFVVDMISAAFNNSSKDLFYGIKNKKTFFRTAYRSMLVRNIINRCTFSADHSEESTQLKGLSGLLHHGAYDDAFILHERSEYDSNFPPPKRKKLTEDISNRDSRKELNDTWLKIFKFQPLWKIRDYYGEKIAFYFAWLGVLITSLWIPVLLGILVFVYGFLTAYNHSGQTLNWEHFKDLVPKALDNEATPYFAIIICLWGTIFLELWKRKNAELAYKWDVDTFEEQELNRPQFYGTKVVFDPFTDSHEPHYPTWRKVIKTMGSLAVIAFMVLLVLASVISIVVYKVVSRVDWFPKQLSSTMSSLTSSVLNTISILLLGNLYRGLAYKLTDWENHQTDTQYEDALILKLFGFQFINSYASLYYIAFFRERTKDTGVFDLGSNYSDSCGETNDCMALLSMQVAILIIAKPMPKFFSDIIKPFLMKKWQKIKPQCFCFRSNQVLTSNTSLPNEDSDMSNEYEKYMEEEFNKPALNDFTLSEYTEKVIQYGYLMLFASAFPLAPLIAVVSNLIDLRIDARRLLWFNRRPVPERAEDIGMWFTILSFLNYVGIITNAFIIGLISRFAREYKTSNKHSLPLNTTLLVDFNSTTSFHINTNSTTKISFSVETFQNLWIIIIFENVALAVKFLVAYLIPDEPEKITRAKKAEKIHMEKLLSRNGLKSGPGKSIRTS